MKTIQALYNEIMADKELKAQFIEAANAGKEEEFLKKQGCEATMEEVAAFLKAKEEEDAPLSLDELENSAGGNCNAQTKKEAKWSMLSLGLYCATKAIQSAAETGKHVGQENSRDGRLCSND